MSTARVALLADSHDQLVTLKKALAEIKREDCSHLIHAGDLCAPFVIADLANGFEGPIHIVFGNNEGDGRLCQQVASKFDNVTLHGPYFEMELDGLRCAAIHYPEPALRIAQSGHLDLVVYGHDHTAHHSVHGECHLVNPGEIMGRLGQPSWGLFDSASRTYSRFLL